jgi:hypothetical protein
MRKLAGGTSPKEALRFLKRRLSDAVYRCLVPTSTSSRATDLVRVAREPMPDVLDPQHRQPLLIGDGVAQPGMPVGDMAMQVPQPH